MTVKISDHALVRWLERAHDIDMEHFRGLLEKLAEPYAKLKVAHVEVGGVWFVFQGDTLATVTPTKPRPASHYRHDRGDHNGHGKHAEKQSWQSMKRRRSHK